MAIDVRNKLHFCNFLIKIKIASSTISMSATNKFDLHDPQVCSQSLVSLTRSYTMDRRRSRRKWS